MPEVDIALALGRAVAPPAVSLLRAHGKKKYDGFIATYTNIFNSFLEATEHKCGFLKTLLNRDVPISLKQLYVETVFESGVTDKSVVDRIKSDTGGFVITGLAGSGKSMFMKWAALTLIEQMPSHQRIPLFVEIRDLDYSDDDRHFENRVFEYCVSSGNYANIDQFKIGLREGVFILMLDGVDEAPADKLDHLLSSIRKFHDTYRQCAIVASVRPGTQLSNITMFRVLKVRAMSLEQVKAVLEKVPYNADRKKILVDSLEGGLYETHNSFLSNPLLVTIMLITFDDASRVPTSLTGFYSAAFDALFSRHDWSKGVFVRKHVTGLEKADFERAFMYFCYQSYFYSSYVFTRDDILELIQSSLSLATLQVRAEDYLTDCIVSVCLLQVDEPKIIFVHRSFQEYFTAKFVSRYSGPKLAPLIDWLVARSSTDDTFLMSVQLNREAIARAWGVSKCNELIGLWRSFISNDEPMKVLDSLGIMSVGFDLRSGEITSYVGKDGLGLELVNGLLALGSDAPSSLDSYVLTGNVYGSKKFVDLSGELKSLIHRFTCAGEIVVTPLKEWSGLAIASSNLKQIAEAQVSLLEAMLNRLEDMIAIQDRFAEMVELVHPLEPGIIGG